MASELYSAHVAARRKRADAALEATGFEALLLTSGNPFLYHADDMHPPHHPTPHFASWVPLEGPCHVLLATRGERPKLVRVSPEDYWYEQAPLGSPFWAAEFELSQVGTLDAAWKAAGAKGRCAYVGDDPDWAREHGFADDAINPAELVARLDWDRSYKTAYEVACIEGAQKDAARGHLAARSAFEAGASELEIHHAYVAAVGCSDKQLPYETIIALDEKGAILHYFAKRTERDTGRVLLIDAGATHLGYASDITRTWTREGCDSRFAELVLGMDRLQQELVALVKPGLPYPDLHHHAHQKTAALLSAVGVLKVDGEEAVTRGLTGPFLPHGLGHFLGIQVHDVSGHQKEPAGGTSTPPARYPFLRTTRTIEKDMVFTIEPGLYFIEMLLREHRSGPTAEAFDWTLIDELAPFGGIRIEDNVLVTADGHRNLTRPFL